MDFSCTAKSHSNLLLLPTSGRKSLPEKEFYDLFTQEHPLRLKLEPREIIIRFYVFVQKITSSD